MWTESNASRCSRGSVCGMYTSLWWGIFAQQCTGICLVVLILVQLSIHSRGSQITVDCHHMAEDNRERLTAATATAHALTTTASLVVICKHLSV